MKKSILFLGLLFAASAGFSQSKEVNGNEKMSQTNTQIQDGVYKAKISKKTTPNADGTTGPGFEDVVEVKVIGGVISDIGPLRFYRTDYAEKLISSFLRLNNKGYYVAEVNSFEQNIRNKSDKGYLFTYLLVINPNQRVK